MRYGIAYNGFFSQSTVQAAANALDYSIVDRVWLAEHLGYRDAFVPAVSVLSSSQGLSVVPTAVSPFARSPMITAMQVAALEELAPERVGLALGAGNPMAYSEAGIRQERPLKAMREYIRVLRDLWSGERVEFLGEVFALSGATFHVPMEPLPKIHIAATGERMLHLAGEVADGVLLSAGLPPAALAANLERLHDGPRGGPAPQQSFESSAFVVTAVDEEPTRAYAYAREALAYLLRNPVIAGQVNAAGVQIDGARLASAASDRDWQRASEEVGIDVVEACSLVGTWKDCLDGLERFRQAGVDNVVFFPVGGMAGFRSVCDMVSRVP